MVKVIEDRKVEYKNEITSLSAITDRIEGHATQGPALFTYNGEKVSDIAERTQWKDYN